LASLLITGGAPAASQTLLNVHLNESGTVLNATGMSPEEAREALEFDLQQELRAAARGQALLAQAARPVATEPESHPRAVTAAPVPTLALARHNQRADAPRNCWHEAGERYQISPWLLYAIAQAESDLRPNAMNRDHFKRTGTVDIGLMQINSSHLRPNHPLAMNGIGERELRDPCINIHVGAWLLAENIRRTGPKWDAVGAYNAVCSQLKGAACTKARKKYIDRVWSKLTRSAPAQPINPAPAIAVIPVAAPRAASSEPRQRIGGRT
jgi:soluble lytic murein transglycosylase-like protein